jgi:hypothetical protein
VPVKTQTATVVQLNFTATELTRLDTWGPTIATELRMNAPVYVGSEGETRIGRRGSLAIYPDGGWMDFEGDHGGPGALSLILYLGGQDPAWVRRFVQDWLQAHPGNGPLHPDTIGEGEAKKRAERYAARAREVLAEIQPIVGTVSETYLTDRTLPGSYPTGLLGHLPVNKARLGECALVATLTDSKGSVLGVQVGYLTPSGRKSVVSPPRMQFWIELDPGRRKEGLFRIAATPLAEKSGDEKDLESVTLIAEGIENIFSVHKAFPCVPCIGLPGIGRLRWIPQIDGDVVIVRDGDEPGSPADKSLVRGIDHLLLTGTKTVRITTTPRGEDPNSILQRAGVEALRDIIRAAKPIELSLDGEAQRLAGIRNVLDYEQERVAVAKKRGVRRSKLDQVVAAKRRQTLNGAEDHGEEDELGPAPWPEPVTDIAAVLSAVSDDLSEYVIASQAIRDTAALWGLCTHFIHHSVIEIVIGARLGIYAVSPVCGKSTFLNLIQQFVRRPMTASSLTPALVNRTVDKFRPTLIIDEADGLMRSNRHPELIALLNAAHNRHLANIPRLVPTSDGGWDVRMFSAWHVHAFTAVRRLEDSQQSRAITVTLLRAKPSELQELRRKRARKVRLKQLRAAAAISGDPRMTADFADGVDLHRQQAATMLGITYDEVDAKARDRAKPVNFSMIYGAGAAGLVATAWNNYGVTLALIEAERARQSFLTRYATYADWMRRNHIQCVTMGVIKIGRLGRVIEAAWEKGISAINGRSPRFRRDDNEHDDMDAADAFKGNGETLKYTLCCNAPIQGACADASMLALTKVDAALQRAGIVGGLVLFVHDEIVLEVADRHAERACRLLADCMVQAFAETFPGAPLSDVVSTGIGKTWGGAKP